MKKASYKRSAYVYFHDIGLGGMDEMDTKQWKMLSLDGVIKYLGHENVSHDDVIKWKHFPRYWPFVRGIHR